MMVLDKITFRTEKNQAEENITENYKTAGKINKTVIIIIYVKIVI